MDQLVTNNSTAGILGDHPSSDAFLAIINASHWPIDKQIEPADFREKQTYRSFSLSRNKKIN